MRRSTARQGHYATLAHEATHWTYQSRLDRFSRFNDRKAYAFEELIAEIGNCMTCARLGLTPDFDQSGAYVQSWLRALKDDKRLIFKAASEAQKAAEWLMKASRSRKKEGRMSGPHPCRSCPAANAAGAILGLSRAGRGRDRNLHLHGLRRGAAG